MATIVNTPAQSDATSSGLGFLLGAILLILLVVGLLYYGGALLRGVTGGSSGGTQSAPATEVNIPDRLDVNVNTETAPQEGQ